MVTVLLQDQVQTELQGENEESFGYKYEYECLMKKMDSLDSKHRIVLVLRYLNELSYEEISRVINIPLGTVKSRIFTALKVLREQTTARNIY